MGDFGQGLLNFLGSPAALGLAQGLLSASRDQYGRPQRMGPGIAAGLLSMQQAQDADRQRKMQEGYFDLAKDKFGLQKQAFRMQQEEAERAREVERARNEYLGGILSEKEPGLAPFSDEKMERAGLLYNMGDIAGATKILSEKPAEAPASIKMKQAQAENIDKTLASIKVDDLVQFSGPAGAMQKHFQSLPSFQTKNYGRFKTAETQAQLLASQVRAFYGDSIAPAMMEKLEKLTNPSDFNLSPEQAKKNFLALKDLLQKEGQTYKDAANPQQKRKQPKTQEVFPNNDPVRMWE